MASENAGERAAGIKQVVLAGVLASAERAIGPRQAFLVTSAYRGKANICTIDRLVHVPGKREFLAFAIRESSLTLELLTRSGEFVVAVPGEGMKEPCELAGSVSGNVVDKFSEGKIETERGISVSAPLLKDALANFECRVSHIINCTDWSIVVGEVERAHAGQGGGFLYKGDEGLFALQRKNGV